MNGPNQKYISIFRPILFLLLIVNRGLDNNKNIRLPDWKRDVWKWNCKMQPFFAMQRALQKCRATPRYVTDIHVVRNSEERLVKIFLHLKTRHLVFTFKIQYLKKDTPKSCPKNCRLSLEFLCLLKATFFDESCLVYKRWLYCWRKILLMEDRALISLLGWYLGR